MPDSPTYASAEPEKRLFISLLTRDISLVDAVLDLIDNSINSAIIVQKAQLTQPSDYLKLLELADVPELPSVQIRFDEDFFSILDTCGGIPFNIAESQVFRFGRDDDDDPSETSDAPHEGDRLSVYGIGLKRAIFKIGNHIVMRSANPHGGFSMDLKVGAWGRLRQDKWQIPIDHFDGTIDDKYGTEIQIKDLYPEIRRRISGGTFGSDLERRIARTYNYFLGRLVNVEVNGKTIVPIDIAFGENTASDSFTLDGVACAVVAGIGIPKGKFHTTDVAGWYVFCNGRAVAFADKTELTGWGTYLPTFQPKHRPFVGNVFFTSEDPEQLPWTTTKSSINRENAVWQHALTVMGVVGKQITSYLDGRYSDDGTEITADELNEVAGKPESTLSTISAGAKSFTFKKAKREDTSIQFNIKIAEVDEVRSYLGKRSMSNGAVGRHTFDYFLENVVRE